MNYGKRIAATTVSLLTACTLFFNVVAAGDYITVSDIKDDDGNVTVPNGQMSVNMTELVSDQKIDAITDVTGITVKYTFADEGYAYCGIAAGSDLIGWKNIGQAGTDKDVLTFDNGSPIFTGEEKWANLYTQVWDGYAPIGYEVTLTGDEGKSVWSGTLTGLTLPDDYKPPEPIEEVNVTVHEGEAMTATDENKGGTTFIYDLDGVTLSQIDKITATFTNSNPTRDDYSNGVIGWSRGEYEGSWADTGKLGTTGKTTVWTAYPSGTIDGAVMLQVWWMEEGNVADIRTIMYDANGNVLRAYGNPTAEELAAAQKDAEAAARAAAEAAGRAAAEAAARAAAEAAAQTTSQNTDDTSAATNESETSTSAEETAAEQTAAEQTATEATATEQTNDTKTVQPATEIVVDSTKAKVTTKTVEKAIEAAEDGVATVAVKKETAAVTKAAIEKMIKSDTTVEFNAGSYSITIDPENVKNAKSLDLGMNIKTKAKTVNGKEVPKGSVTVYSDQKGSFGATLGVTIAADKVKNLKLSKLKLYRIDKNGKPVRIKNALKVNDDGTVTIKMSKRYAFVLTDKKIK